MSLVVPDLRRQPTAQEGNHQECSRSQLSVRVIEMLTGSDYQHDEQIKVANSSNARDGDEPFLLIRVQLLKSSSKRAKVFFQHSDQLRIAGLSHLQFSIFLKRNNNPFIRSQDFLVSLSSFDPNYLEWQNL